MVSGGRCSGLGTAADQRPLHRALRCELSAQANKSPGLGHFRMSNVLRRLRLRCLMR
jgi:hypothetical protein